MQQGLDIAKEAENPVVSGLDFGCLDRGDLVNLILQRSEVMFDRPRSGQVIRAWGAGDMAPMEAEVDRLGAQIAQRAAGVIHAEYRALAPVLRALAPKRVADIGCGYAFFDLFLAKDLNPDLVLIDLESNEHRHFGFQAEGAAYSSLARAKELLGANGVATTQITTLNPREVAPETIEPVDLAVSFLSCGFHYPVDLYVPFLDKVLKPGGAAIFDLRAETATAQAATLSQFGTLSDLDAPPKTRRVLLRKAAA
ncbi:class I SAM-dependent methyltransferase [Pseudorhodobacter turbinis]|uniref:Class I SAM-dependent methyltransferase n=1 Tax=Pseudorhodobacter turbinis TaxID=2500533 RepID=A0A4P8ECM0_9RHOB|nr:class I SAM-dependent methyltransferase [Pseudorhodobacter turbinis]QCO54457.1 class I SAM-dependent methyltransferase [Pseudorhodobacter turbinis]